MNEEEEWLEENCNVIVDTAGERRYIIMTEQLQQYAQQVCLDYKDYLLDEYGYVDRPLDIPDSSYDDFTDHQNQ